MRTATKADIETQREGEMAFYDAKDAVIYGEGMVRAAQEAAELKEQTQQMQAGIGMPGMVNFAQLGTLDLTELTNLMYGNTNSADNDTNNGMPQITETERTSGLNSQQQNQNIGLETVASVEHKVGNKKREGQDLDAKSRNGKDQKRGDIEIKEIPKKEVGKEEKVTEIDKDKNLGDERGNKADKRQLRNGKQRSVRTNDEKDNRLQDEKKPQSKNPQSKQQVRPVKEETKVIAKTTDITHRSSDPKKGTEIRQEREIVAKTKTQERQRTPEKDAQNQNKGHGLQGMEARLAGAREAARAGNMMQSVANITQATGRTMTIRDGNNTFMTEKGQDGLTYAYINGKQVGAQDASKFFEKMNAKMGPERTAQLERVIGQVAVNYPRLK